VIRTVTILESGRSGEVRYKDPRGSLRGYWEFGGGDVVVIIAMGAPAAWPRALADDKDAVLDFIAAEAIRQRSPTSRPDIDRESGDILLREPGGAIRSPGTPMAPTPRQEAADFVTRYRGVRSRFVRWALVATLVVGVLAWFKSEVLVTRPGKGAPIAPSMLTGDHVATLISTLQPYTPSLKGNPEDERDTVSVFIVPLDGAEPLLVPILGDLEHGGYSLAHVIGSDGRTLWVAVNGLRGVDLASRALVTAADVRAANPALPPGLLDDTRGMDLVEGRLRIRTPDRSAAWTLDPVTRVAAPATATARGRPPLEPRVTAYLAAGVYTPPGQWLGLHADADLTGGFEPGGVIRAVEGASEKWELRRLYRGELETPRDDGLLRIRTVAPVGADTYPNAAFLRPGPDAEPVRLADPDGALMLYEEPADRRGTLRVARVDTAGQVLWSMDTGIDRFQLQQILPGSGLTAFVGPRPAVPDVVPEPLLVILENATGKLTVHSLWQ